MNNQTGSVDVDGRTAESAGDGNSGPVKTIMQAVRKCAVGARIEIANTGVAAMEYGRIERCTIVNSPVGVDVAVGASIRNSIIANCPTTLRIGKNAVDAVAVDKTIFGLGEVAVDGQKINPAGWPEFITTHKRLAGAVKDSPVNGSTSFQGTCREISRDSSAA